MASGDERGSRVIRRAERSDLDSIVSFQIAMARETEALELDVAVCRRGVAAVLDDESLGQYWVVTEAGRAVGALMTTSEWSDWRAGRVWWIQSVYIIPEWRRQGAYSALYKHVQAAAIDREDVRGIRLYVDRRNAAAQQTYRALGMDGAHYVVFEWMKR